MAEPVFLITGASRGIGAATARLAAAEGYRLVLLGRSPEPLREVAEETGGLPIACDVTDWDALSAAVRRVEDELGRLDVVFANAGQSVVTSFLGEAGEEPGRWRDMVLANVYGPALTARATLPVLRRFGGHLVLTGSASGRGVRPGSLYSATKWAVTGLAQAIRAECVDAGVRVTLVQPGLVDTEAIPADRAADPKLDPADVGRAVLYAVGQPSHVDVNEILVRPVGQGPYR
ncbi:SDR family oxidoreductase [Allokutzneria oryzae]|uniref:SDR family oxidoreductase n=1 Tax=Allokutzneria oryzae TaxID=1378989 RepID=A0ABV6ABI1_9PSEU